MQGLRRESRLYSRSHSLRYNLTVVSQNGSVSSEFFAEEYLDDERFLFYDGQQGRAEPQGPWAEASLGNETLETETKDLVEKGKYLKMTKAQITGQKGLGAVWHSLQEITECKIHENNSISGFRHFYYHGEHVLSQNLKTQKQTVPPSSGAHTLAMNIRKVLDEDAMTRLDAVLADCVQKLQQYLKLRRLSFRRAVAPTVNVTHSQVLDGYMGHSRNQSTHTVLSGNAPRPRSHRLAILCTALVIALAVVCVF
ncbi:MHC class I polypeptide-related sequence B isoform X1 [Otolemur garnettii]|uniref:MHC class I polypeptide-related sequence B isoform X1 n=1 Tax=Otolemur garnettii TaxID=30611 RepID=UPI000C7F5A8F|nr:MHC class I polypeptide-related sequence B isoform X1 [Otolemur garnettii]